MSRATLFLRQLIIMRRASRRAAIFGCAFTLPASRIRHFICRRHVFYASR